VQEPKSISAAIAGKGDGKVKLFKMLGLAAVAALMAMAFVGASSAMAESTALCKEDTALFEKEGEKKYVATDECPGAQRISHVHEESVGKGLLLSSIVEIKCNVLFLGDVISANNLGNPLEILGHFTYPKAGCETENGTQCEVKETSTHAIIKVLRLGHELADVTGSAEVNAHCGFFINCTYNGEGLSGHALGPLLSTQANGEVRVEEQTTHKTGGSLCPESAKLDLLTTPLEKTYISS
jgi:hypothetical protein